MPPEVLGHTATVCYFLFQMTKKCNLPNFALIMSESMAKNDFHQKKKFPLCPFLQSQAKQNGVH